MAIFDWFAGGTQDISGLREQQRIAQQLFREQQQATGPSAQELAMQEAFRQAQERLFANQAGMRGPQAAASQQRLQGVMPIFSGQQAAQQQHAAAAAEEARRAEQARLFQLMGQSERDIVAAQEAERQRKAQMRQQAVSGLFDVGTTVAGAM
jgi:hypothetical protein